MKCFCLFLLLVTHLNREHLWILRMVVKIKSVKWVAQCFSCSACSVPSTVVGGGPRTGEVLQTPSPTVSGGPVTVSDYWHWIS